MALSWKSSAPLGATLELSCNKGTVVVGLELYSAPPEDAWKPYKDASGESARCGRSGDDPCPEPGLVCSNTVCGQWVATASGACLGIGGLYCADAAAVAAGANPKPVYVPLAGGGIGGNRDLVFARPGAYALSAVDIAYLPKGGATQLTVYDRPFTHASATLTALIASPPKPTPGQKVTRLNCAASPGGGASSSPASRRPSPARPTATNSPRWAPWGSAAPTTGTSSAPGPTCSAAASGGLNKGAPSSPPRGRSATRPSPPTAAGAGPTRRGAGASLPPWRGAADAPSATTAAARPGTPRRPRRTAPGRSRSLLAPPC